MTNNNDHNSKRIDNMEEAFRIMAETQRSQDETQRQQAETQRQQAEGGHRIRFARRANLHQRVDEIMGGAIAAEGDDSLAAAAHRTLEQGGQFVRRRSLYGFNIAERRLNLRE